MNFNQNQFFGEGSVKEVKKRYFKLSLLCHPDKHLDWTSNEKRMATKVFIEMKSNYDSVHSGNNQRVFTFPIVLKSESRSEGLPILISAHETVDENNFIQVVKNLMHSLYQINYNMTIDYESPIKPWSTINVTRRPVLSIENYDEFPFERSSIDIIVEYYGNFLIRLDNEILQKIIHEFLYNGREQKIKLFKDEDSADISIDGHLIKIYRGKYVKPSQLTFFKFSYVLSVLNREIERPVYSTFSNNLSFGPSLSAVERELRLSLHHGFQFRWFHNYEDLSVRKNKLITYCAALSLDLIMNAIKFLTRKTSTKIINAFQTLELPQKDRGFYSDLCRYVGWDQIKEFENEENNFLFSNLDQILFNYKN